MNSGNLFDSTSPAETGERFEEILRHRNLAIERIVSSSRIIPSEYIQAQDEWVVLLRGEAELSVEGITHQLAAGDYLFLPAHTPHTVLKTSEGALWLAVHLFPS